jgi:hypothetical protein
MEIDTEKLLKAMLKAASVVLKKQWPKSRDYAENEFRKLLLEAQHISRLKEDAKITEQEARYLMDLQRNASRAVLLTIKGLGIIAVEEAINAALDVARDTINDALGGWKIL